MSGFPKPNHTQVPNSFFEQMASMNEAELRVTLHAIRQTFGWHKTRDEISLSQFQKSTGLSRQGVLNGIADAEKRGTLKKAGTGKRGTTIFELIVTEPDNVIMLDQSTQLTSTSQVSRPEVVNEVDTQKKEERKVKKSKEPDQPEPLKDEPVEPEPLNADDFQKKIDVVREAGLLQSNDFASFKVDADDYTLDQWQRGVEIVKERRKADGKFKNYRYLLTVMSGVEAEDKQAAAIQSTPAPIVPYHKPAVLDDYKVTPEQRAEALAMLEASRKGKSA